MCDRSVKKEGQPGKSFLVGIAKNPVFVAHFPHVPHMRAFPINLMTAFAHEELFIIKPGLRFKPVQNVRFGDGA